MNEPQPATRKRIGVVGCGLMGSGIAEVCARADLEVVVVESTAAAASAGKSRLETVEWPTAATRQPQKPGQRARTKIRIEAKRPVAPAPNLVDLLADFSLVDALDEGAPAGSLVNLEKLAEALEDGEITPEEMFALDEISVAYDMSDGDRTSANGGLLLALCHLALDDGAVSRAERKELERSQPC